MRVLILGGTTEASELAELLAGDARFEATLSLAGRTSTPKPQPIATRVGGFGGADGLADFLRAQKIDAVIDATHPYAAAHFRQRRRGLRARRHGTRLVRAPRLEARAAAMPGRSCPPPSPRPLHSARRRAASS